MIFCAVVLVCAGALGFSFPKSIWFWALYSPTGPKYLYLATKSSYLHVYLVPTRLLIFRKISHLHVYLVYTFVQYQGVYWFYLLKNWLVAKMSLSTGLSLHLVSLNQESIVDVFRDQNNSNTHNFVDCRALNFFSVYPYPSVFPNTGWSLF